jgi:hypothetical protein
VSGEMDRLVRVMGRPTTRTEAQRREVGLHRRRATFFVFQAYGDSDASVEDNSELFSGPDTEGMQQEARRQVESLEDAEPMMFVSRFTLRTRRQFDHLASCRRFTLLCFRRIGGKFGAAD